MISKSLIICSMFIIATQAQRSPYAGRNPVGYPEIRPVTTTTTQSNQLADRIGEPAPSTTTMRLPIEALGDQDLVNQISKLPLDHQPFWYINWQAMEAHRQRPLTYPQKGNDFLDIVVNKLLAFLQQKLDLMDEVTAIQISKSSFTQDDISEA